jgi:hypothetical protein
LPVGLNPDKGASNAMKTRTKNSPSQASTGNGTCSQCGQRTLYLVVKAPHLRRLDCLTCGHVGKWLPSPWTPERASSFRLWFGKHEGRTIGELLTMSDGRNYLRWLAQDATGVEENVQIAACIALGLRQPD